LRRWWQCMLSECCGYTNEDDRQEDAESFHDSSFG